MLDTAFTRLVGCEVPIQLAGMGGVLTPELAAAVSNAGALGQITLGGIEPAEANQRLDKLASLTTKPFGVNILIPYLDKAILSDAVHKARVIDFFWGDPDPELVRVVHGAGALCSWQVGSVAEAVAAEKAGCDFIIAQGVEAGGHIRGTLGLLPLLTQVLDKVKVPVLAAGGIGSGRGNRGGAVGGSVRRPDGDQVHRRNGVERAPRLRKGDHLRPGRGQRAHKPIRGRVPDVPLDPRRLEICARGRGRLRWGVRRRAQWGADRPFHGRHAVERLQRQHRRDGVLRGTVGGRGSGRTAGRGDSR